MSCLTAWFAILWPCVADNYFKWRIKMQECVQTSLGRDECNWILAVTRCQKYVNIFFRIYLQDVEIARWKRARECLKQSEIKVGLKAMSQWYSKKIAKQKISKQLPSYGRFNMQITNTSTLYKTCTMKNWRWKWIYMLEMTMLKERSH